MPIDSRTRMASRATLRDTPCSALTPSRVITSPGAYVPATTAVPSALRTLSCSALTFEGITTHNIVS